MPRLKRKSMDMRRRERRDGARIKRAAVRAAEEKTPRAQVAADIQHASMSAASHGHRAQVAFTVEQMELIRRLRNSGLTREHVLQAYDAFDKVEYELGDLYATPVSVSQQRVVAASSPQARYSHLSHSTHHLQNGNSQSYQHSLKDFPGAGSAANGKSTNGFMTSKPSVSLESPVRHVNRRFHGVKRPREVIVKLEREETSGNGDVIYDSVPVQEERVKVGLHHAMQEENRKDVDEFLKKGTEQMHEDVREFLFANPSIMHSDIASMAGVSVTCVSKFLVGNFPALQPSVLRQLCHWFLVARRQQPLSQPIRQQQQCQSHTSRLLQDVIQERLLTTTASGSEASPMDEGADTKVGDALTGALKSFGYEQDGVTVNYAPRRERFTFRKKHLEMLESFFNTNQYPTYEERIALVQRCNETMEAQSGRELGEKERMTIQNVAYWFSNRRKDLKRLAREGNIEMVDTVPSSRVQPSPPSSSQGEETLEGSTTWDLNHGTSTMDYHPTPDFPSVGPIAFPTMVATTTSGDAPCTDSNPSYKAGGDFQPNVIKTEPPDVESFPPVLVAPGSTVDKIAADITSRIAQSTSSPPPSVTGVEGCGQQPVTGREDCANDEVVTG